MIFKKKRQGSGHRRLRHSLGLTLWLPALLPLLCSHTSAAAADSTFNSTYGSTAGISTPDPQWSIGAQVGNYAASGLSAQRMGIGGGAIDLGLGLAYGSIALHGDYLAFVDNTFSIKYLADGDGYKTTRGQLLGYFGGGAQVASGVDLRLPLGVQYTMSRDPVSFFGGADLILGRFFANDRAIDLSAWLNLGVRLLL